MDELAEESYDIDILSSNEESKRSMTDFKFGNESNKSSESCTQKYLINITQFFLDKFGTDTIPDGYVEGADYGPRYKNQDFAELFTIFYVLLAVTVLCLLALLVMILLLVWLKQHDGERKQCKHLNRFSVFLLIMLLLLVILMAFPLYLTLKNGWDLRKRIKSENSNSNKTELERLIENIENKTNRLLISDYVHMKNEALSEYDDIPIPPPQEFHNTSTAIRLAKKNVDKFDQFIVDYIEEEFLNVLFFDDAYRTTSRNTSAYVGYEERGYKIVMDRKVSRYDDYIFTLAEWATYYQQADAISKLHHYYQNLDPAPLTTANQKAEIRQHIKNYLDNRGHDAKLLNNEIGNLLKSRNGKRETNSPVAIVTNFAIIMCFIAIVVLLSYLIILLWSLFKKRNRNRAMSKPLIIIYVILTLLLEVMAFVFFFTFFYGIIDYNTTCNKTGKQSGKSFYNLYTQCNEDEKIYTLIMNNNLIDHPLSEWQTMATSNIEKICSTCSPLNFNFVNETYYDAKDFRKTSQCKHIIPTKAAQKWRNDFSRDIWNYRADTMRDHIPEKHYYWERKKFSACDLDFSDKLVKFQENQKEVDVIFPPYSTEKTDGCSEGHKLANESMVYIGASIDEVSKMCNQNHDECLSYKNGASKVQHKVSAYQLNTDKKLIEEIGSCSIIMRLSKERRNEFCNCDTNMLNGIWVGCLLFLLGLFISLMLLTCLICIYKNCDNDRVARRSTRPRRRGERGSRGPFDSSQSIVLPPVVLPKAAINIMRANPDPQVSYMVKKKTR